ncbi:Ubiquitin-conjugating enzyme E2, catalytic domain ues [Orobanche gracilis]
MSHSAERNKRKDMWGNEEISDKRARFFEENGNGRRRYEDANQTGSTANLIVGILSKVTSKIIIDVEDVDDDDVMVLDGDAGTGSKGEESISAESMSGFTVVSSSITSGESGLYAGPANNQNSPSPMVTQKIVIDIDVEDDDDYEVMVIDGDVGTSVKGKDSMSRFPVITSGITSGASGLHVGPANTQSSASPMASASVRIDPEDVTEIVQKYNVFKKLELVDDYSDHYFSRSWCAKRPPKKWTKRIQEEWKILEKHLPDKIFVRAYESRMDLLRAVIVGVEGTPYHDGLYFFDVYFPCKYPSVPPHVEHLSRGRDINPNLIGPVCVSLLNISGNDWIPGTSTLLQVLVSIQGLVLNAKPYFNIPRPTRFIPTPIQNEKCASNYNEEVFILSLQMMVYQIRRPPKHFEDFVVGHFRKHGRDILVCCEAYMNGAQVGSLFKGVQDVDEGDKSCSQQFKHDMVRFISNVVNAFMQIGAKDCEEFLSLAQKPIGPPQSLSDYYRSTTDIFFSY